MIVTDQTFDSVVNDSDLILIDFWAEWCGPCRMVSPVLDDISESTGLLVGKLNIDENPEKTQEYSASITIWFSFSKKLILPPFL